MTFCHPTGLTVARPGLGLAFWIFWVVGPATLGSP
jgi:hypothetical protein